MAERSWLTIWLTALLAAAAVAGCTAGRQHLGRPGDGAASPEANDELELLEARAELDRSVEIDTSGCHYDGSATLKGVSLDLSGNPCQFTLAQAAAGITFHYRITVEVELHQVVSLALDAGQCDDAGPADLRVLEKVHGGGNSWCICDRGLCQGITEEITLLPGEYADSFTWDGRNWNGPSDTGNPPGAPFPPGDYKVVLRAEGRHGPLQASFAVTGTMELTLVE